MIGEEYRFYLSLENSNCVVYVTGKFFSIFKLDVIPLVIGGANCSQLVPKYSYIDENDFKSPQHAVT